MEIVEVLMVAPPEASTPQNSKLSLTFFDLLWLRLPQTERLFFYEYPTPNTTIFNSETLPRLKQSLSLTLQHFPPLAGNLTWPPTSPKPVVEYIKGDAVSLTVAKANADSYFHQLSSNNFSEATAYHTLTPKLAVSRDRAAILAVQVTLFPSHGFSIGLAFNHAILDGKSLSLFVKSWSHICRSLGGDICVDHQSSSCVLPPDLKPSFDRSLIKDTAGIGDIYANTWLNVDGTNNRSLLPRDCELLPDLIRGTFQLSRQKIEKLRQLVMNKIQNSEQQYHDDDQVHVSTFSLTCAYTWTCLVKAEGVSENKANMALMFAADCRSRLEPPLPATYFGNCIRGKLAVAESEGLSGKEGLVVAVQAISTAIKSLDKQLLDGAENWVSSVARNKLSNPGRRLYHSIAGSPRFEVYGTDFGWGPPTKVDVVTIDKTRSICLSDNRNGDGVEIGLVLEKLQMQAFASLFAQGLECL